MAVVKTFPMGGVHPPENKFTADSAIQILDPPDEVAILLGQHIGAPAEAVVQKGDTVKVGTLIGEGKAFISANVHSSVSGTVKRVDEALDAAGFRKPAVVISVEGDEWEERIDRSPELVTEINTPAEEIVQRIKAAGIVGMGGAAFPTNVKYMVPEGKQVDTLVINGVECEPYLTADHRLMLEHTDEVLIGVEVLRRALQVERAVIGIELNKPDAIEIMSKHAERFPHIEVYGLKVQYPQGAEKQLIKAILDREVPGGKLPLDVGCVVNNVGTALAAYHEIQKNRPLIDRVVTVTGSSLSKRGNFQVRIGTPFSHAIEAAGGMPGDVAKVIAGGPMMGKAVPDLNVSVTKGTSGILLLNKREAQREETVACIRCSKCVSACPIGLEPYLLEKLARMEYWEQSDEHDVLDCIECGSCSYICPSNRPLLDYIKLGKVKVHEMRRASAG